jgi:hypothetical protein
MIWTEPTLRVSLSVQRASMRECNFVLENLICINLNILQVGSSHYRNGRRKAVSLLHPGRPRGLVLVESSSTLLQSPGSVFATKCA